MRLDLLEDGAVAGREGRRGVGALSEQVVGQGNLQLDGERTGAVVDLRLARNVKTSVSVFGPKRVHSLVLAEGTDVDEARDSHC